MRPLRGSTWKPTTSTFLALPDGAAVGSAFPTWMVPVFCWTSARCNKRYASMASERARRSSSVALDQLSASSSVGY
eukprot:CAMPEP_0180490338 /NCGR_PEP_ID=MMETSP1036_2-20121128/39064_1 /TAXON_ID=632150 /ORGANISM="Azadinium spinosum, Strain 3D9" /LENGTH=75 /DNA_ID=CAMNT_0022498529 /DNA_START=341 /DNA_END=565 /DNA_ORIENTATION=+